MNIASLLKAAPKGLQLLDMAQRAAQGDPEAVAYLRENGLYDALDIIVHPGAGAAGRQVLDGVRGMMGDNGVIETPDPERLPWSGFCKRFIKMRSGGVIVLGQMGTGKTSLGVKLVWNWVDQLGYDAEFIGLYGTDLPNFGRTVHFETLVHRMGCLTEHLKAQGSPDAEEYFVSDPNDDADNDVEARRQTRRKPKPRYRAQLPPGHRAILIDEMGMQVKRGVQSAQRDAIMQYLAQSRHCDTTVIFLAQYASMIPLNVLGQAILLVKRPTGKEKDADRDNPLVRQLWEEAEEAFAKLPRSGWMVPPHEDWRSWAYVKCPSLNGAPAYNGLVPFRPYSADDPIEGEFREILEDDARSSLAQ